MKPRFLGPTFWPTEVAVKCANQNQHVFFTPKKWSTEYANEVWSKGDRVTLRLLHAGEGMRGAECNGNFEIQSVHMTRIGWYFNSSGKSWSDAAPRDQTPWVCEITLDKKVEADNFHPLPLHNAKGGSQKLAKVKADDFESGNLWMCDLSQSLHPIIVVPGITGTFTLCSPLGYTSQ